MYFLFCELIILRTKTIHLHTQLEPEMKQPPPHTHTHNLKSQFRLHRLHYSLVFPCIALLFQDMPLQANNLIIHYRNFLKSPINSLIKTTNTSSSKTLCLKILTLLLPPIQILVYHKSYSVPAKPLH